MNPVFRMHCQYSIFYTSEMISLLLILFDQKNFSKFTVSVSNYASTAVLKVLYITCKELYIGVALNHLWI